MMHTGVYNYQTIDESHIKPRNVTVDSFKITVDEFNESLTIENLDEDKKRRRSTGLFYKMQETKRLPKYVRKHKLYKEIRCKLVNNQVEVVWPSKTGQKPIFSSLEAESAPEIPITVIDMDHIRKKREAERAAIEEEKRILREAKEKRRKEDEKAKRRASSVVEDLDLSQYMRKTPSKDGKPSLASRFGLLASLGFNNKKGPQQLDESLLEVFEGKAEQQFIEEEDEEQEQEYEIKVEDK